MEFSRLECCSGLPDSKESACNVRDAGLIPGLRRSPKKEMAVHSSILAWRIPWTEQGYSPGVAKSQRDLVTKWQQEQQNTAVEREIRFKI